MRAFRSAVALLVADLPAPIIRWNVIK